jgi:hypothetical protein
VSAAAHTPAAAEVRTATVSTTTTVAPTAAVATPTTFPSRVSSGGKYDRQKNDGDTETEFRHSIEF